jgi:putative hydrolase of the HAD superfamily
MNQIKAIGFDFFNTLMTIDPEALREAWKRLTGSLEKSGLAVESESFRQAYRETAMRLVAESKATGKETHNRFWISAALTAIGQNLGPDDPTISLAVEAYFSTFFDYCRIIPETIEMLNRISGKYRLGILSNFTDGPTVIKLLDHLELAPFFDTVLVSGAIGYRKPLPLVFEMLVENLGSEKDQTLYVGDSLDPDVLGATQSGLRPVWMTYVQDHHLPSVPNLASETDERLVQGVLRVSEWNDLLELLQKT